MCCYLITKRKQWIEVQDVVLSSWFQHIPRGFGIESTSQVKVYYDGKVYNLPYHDIVPLDKVATKSWASIWLVPQAP